MLTWSLLGTRSCPTHMYWYLWGFSMHRYSVHADIIRICTCTAYVPRWVLAFVNPCVSSSLLGTARACWGIDSYAMLLGCLLCMLSYYWLLAVLNEVSCQCPLRYIEQSPCISGRSIWHAHHCHYWLVHPKCKPPKDSLNLVGLYPLGIVAPH